MSADGLSERAAFRIAQHIFLAAGILIVVYWGLALLGNIREPVASTYTLLGAVVALGSLRTGAHWLAGDHRYMYPLVILVWAIGAVGGVTFVIIG